MNVHNKHQQQNLLIHKKCTLSDVSIIFIFFGILKNCCVSREVLYS
jgi:hypothetical protein